MRFTSEQISIGYFIAAVLSCIAALCFFVISHNTALGFIWVAMGTTTLCLGIAWRKRIEKKTWQETQFEALLKQEREEEKKREALEKEEGEYSPLQGLVDILKK